MAISSTTRKTAELQTNGATRLWPISVAPIYSADHVKVFHTVAGVETEISSSQFSVLLGTGNVRDGYNGATVTYPLEPAPPLATGTIRLEITVPLVQELVLSTTSGFDPKIVEKNFDLQTRGLQQIDDGLGTKVAEVTALAAEAEASAEAAAASRSLLDTALLLFPLPDTTITAIPYENRAAAVAANVPAAAYKISVMAPGGFILNYYRDAGGTALTTNGGTISWSPAGSAHPDHFAENTTPGTTDMRAAVQSAITAGNASLLPQAYGMAGGAVLDGDDLSLYMPQGSSIVALNNSNNPLDINGERFTLFGPGEIDCRSIVSGIVAASTAKGLHVSGVSIKNPTARGINCEDNFDADDQITIEDVTIYWDTAGAAAVDQSVLPLVINIQGTGANNVIGVNLLRNTVDMSNWTAEKIALIAYPLVSGAPNPVLFRINQNGTGTISSQNRCEGNRALFPVVPDEGQWDPAFYGNAPDGAGQRRPVCYEIKTTAANGVGAMSFDGNFGDGGDIGASFGSLNGLNYTNNRMQFQTHYCMEAATGDKITGAGNYYDGRFALKPISSTNTRIVNLPGSFVIGPRHDGGTTETAVALQGTTEIINMAGSTFIAATAGPIVRLLGETATNEIANFDGCVFIGNGVVGVDAVEVRNVIATLSLNGATFQDIDGDTLNNLSTIGTLITIGMSEENCGGTATLGTVTRHLSALNNAGAFTNGIELAPAVPSLAVRAGIHDWHYAGSSFASFRNDRDVSLSAPTDDASDTGSFFVSGGGSPGQFRGGTLTLYGNEHATLSGQAILEAGVNRPATIRAHGTGDAILETTGTGRARFGTHSAIGAETVTGFIEIKDSSGTVRKLAVVS